MIVRTVLFAAALSQIMRSAAEIAPEITVVENGYNVVAKVPCLGCPFLFQDTSDGLNKPWTERKDNNALLLNVSLPYDSAFLSINNARLYTGQRILPRTYANQVVQDFSVDELSASIASGQLEASHETNMGGGFFGLSYRQSLRTIRTSQGREALIFQFDIIELYCDLTKPPLQYKLDDPAQKLLQLMLVERPVMSASDPAPAFEILDAGLVSRSQNPPTRLTSLRTMHFLNWDSYGEKGTTAHALTYGATSFLDFLGSSIWVLIGFIFAIMVVFSLVCLLCIFGWGFWSDDYKLAQWQKHRRTRIAMDGDVEMGKRKMRGRFKGPEELGLAERAQVVGLGKND